MLDNPKESDIGNLNSYLQAFEFDYFIIKEKDNNFLKKYFDYYGYEQVYKINDYLLFNVIDDNQEYTFENKNQTETYVLIDNKFGPISDYESYRKTNSHIVAGTLLGRDRFMNDQAYFSLKWGGLSISQRFYSNYFELIKMYEEGKVNGMLIPKDYYEVMIDVNEGLRWTTRILDEIVVTRQVNNIKVNKSSEPLKITLVDVNTEEVIDSTIISFDIDQSKFSRVDLEATREVRINSLDFVYFTNMMGGFRAPSQFNFCQSILLDGWEDICFSKKDKYHYRGSELLALIESGRMDDTTDLILERINTYPETLLTTSALNKIFLWNVFGEGANFNDLEKINYLLEDMANDYK